MHGKSDHIIDHGMEMIYLNIFQINILLSSEKNVVYVYVKMF